MSLFDYQTIASTKMDILNNNLDKKITTTNNLDKKKLQPELKLYKPDIISDGSNSTKSIPTTFSSIGKAFKTYKD